MHAVHRSAHEDQHSYGQCLYLCYPDLMRGNVWRRGSRYPGECSIYESLVSPCTPVSLAIQLPIVHTFRAWRIALSVFTPFHSLLSRYAFELFVSSKRIDSLTNNLIVTFHCPAGEGLLTHISQTIVSTFLYCTNLQLTVYPLTLPRNQLAGLVIAQHLPTPRIHSFEQTLSNNTTVIMLASMLTTTLFASLLGAVANAHLFISSPSPIPGSAIKPPLDASGSDFPCHNAVLPSSGGQSMAAGSQQLLSWDTGNGTNTAVHGGGSCQISLTYETDAAKQKDPSNWFVIYSVEEGCPSNTLGNLEDSYHSSIAGQTYNGSWPCSNTTTNGVDCVNQFEFDIPKGVKTGHAIMAWVSHNISPL